MIVIRLVKAPPPNVLVVKGEMRTEMGRFTFANRPIRETGKHRQKARRGLSVAVVIASVLTFAISARSEKAEADCITRISVFINEVDTWLDAPPKDPTNGAMSVTSLDELVRGYFPMQQCDVARFTEIVKSSRHFESAWENPEVGDEAKKSVSFALKNAYFRVYFALHKQSGATHHEVAMARKD